MSLKDAWERALQNQAESGSKRKSRDAREEVDDGPESTSVPTTMLAASAGPKTTFATQESAPPFVRARIADGATFVVKSESKKSILLPVALEDAGKRVQTPCRRYREERELTIGLDFGTSCTKIVIGDAAAGKSFAVPFNERVGIERYLLASRVFETGGTYSLFDGTVAHRDLKLSFIEGRGGAFSERNVVAYLALAIRRARGWLLTEHLDVYRDAKIYWRLAIGLPSRQNFDSRLSERFRRVALASWYVAGGNDDVNRRVVELELVRVVREGTDSTEVDIRVMPEIAAQIYGFVVSDSFDKKGRNIFLIADVGSGTVDASLFYVREIRGNRHNFSFYTSTVEPYGVVNLHRYRSRWWASALRACDADPVLIREIEESLEATDHGLKVPESFEDYFDGVEIEGTTAWSPDDQFFWRVEEQVIANTFFRAVRDNQVPRHQLERVPFYLCGGGSRMKYYGRLKTRLMHPGGGLGISAVATPLTVPTNLQARGIGKDYDRLSVAYGLGWLDPGWVVETEPMQPIDDTVPTTWRDRFVDKDQM